MNPVNNRSGTSFPLMAPLNNQPDPRPLEQQEANPKKADEQALSTRGVRPGRANLNLQRFLAVHGKTGKASSDDDTPANAELKSHGLGERGEDEPDERDSNTLKFDEHEIGSTSRFRLYSSDSEVSDLSDVSELSLDDSRDSDEDTCEDPLLRLDQRLERKTTELFQGRESILSEHRQVSFDQTNLIEKVVPDKESRPLGICFGLSLEWLNASHVHPSHSAQAMIQFISQDEQARRALDTQHISEQLTYEMPFNRWHRFKESIEKSELNGVQLGKYRKVDNDSRPISDIGIKTATLLRRSGVCTLIAMETNCSGHAIACVRKPNDSFSLFDPDSGAYEVSSEKLPGLLTSIFATHALMVREQQQKDAASNEAAASFSQDNRLPTFSGVFIFPVNFADGSARGVPGLAPVPQDTAAH